MADHRYHRGDQVRFQFGTRLVEGVVKEDRGPIGVGGRRLYLVEFLPEVQASSVFQIELPADDLQAVPAGDGRR